MSIGPKGGLGEHGDAVSRQLILTKASLVERRPENYEVSWILLFYLSGVLILIRFSFLIQIFVLNPSE